MKRQWIVGLVAIFMLSLAACSSSEEKSDAGDEAGIESTDADSEAISDDTEDLEKDETAEEPPTDLKTEPTPSEVAADFGEEPSPTPAEGAVVAEATPEVAPEGTPTDTAVAPVDETVQDSAPKIIAPLQKAKTAAWQSNGRNLNSVYVARPGDTVASVSKKVYGPKKSKWLVADNPILKRGVKPGDKIYYASSARPDDTAVKTYYEDKGIAPLTYVSKPGDNIRTLGKELIGHSNGWKELWVLNQDVESKGDLPEGTALTYWPQGADATDIAQSTETAPPTEPEPPPTNLPPPPVEPPTNTAQNIPPPPPPPPPPPADIPPTNVAGTTGSVEPPPPPPVEPPPVVAEPPRPKKKSAKTDEGFLNDDTMFLIGAVGIGAVVLGGIMMAFRRSKNRKMKLGQTQV